MIRTGKAPMTLMTYCAIMSISLIVNLPGLAVTPMLGTLSTIFPHTTQIEKQLLTALPNLLIIPFVLMSGKLSLTRHKLAIIVGGLVLFTACAVAYMFAPSMAALIVISCLLGCAAGLLIPFSTGLIADTFSGTYRMNQMGIQSGISNSALVVATFVVGWLSHGNWHLPFAVYLVCLIPLVLAFGLRKVTATTDSNPATTTSSTATASTPIKSASTEKTVGGFYMGRIWALIGVYFFVTFASISISYYCPFLIEKKDWSASLSGTITAIYFLFILLPGYFLPFFMKVLKGNTFFWAAVMMLVGQALFVFCADSVTMCIGAALVGLGYGISQPIIYDKAAQCVNNEKKATMALSFVLTANYLAIVVSPFLIGLLRDIFHVAAGGTFAFLISFILLIAYAIITFVMRKKFAFSVTAQDA
ncbi:MAG: MFS transporter [Muribaculaceae bacterium]|nr:MFS transporter [Muribaculaceae bacterium]